jgi:hypothetical protein
MAGQRLVSGCERYDRGVDRPIAAFDVETVPDPNLGRRLYGLEGTDGEVMLGMLERRLQQTGERTDFHAPPFHRVAVVSVAWLDPETGAFKLGSPAGDTVDEAAHLEGFYRLLRHERAPRLVSWNGSGFDLPVIQYRAMVHGLAAPEFYRVGGERERNSYTRRYDDLHVDLMDVLSGFGASSRVRLDDWSRILGLPGKTVMEGSEVHRHFAAGDHELIRTYCELDALNTLLAYLVWRLHTGILDAVQLRDLVAEISRCLQVDERDDVAAFGSALVGWPERVGRCT